MSNYTTRILAGTVIGLVTYFIPIINLLGPIVAGVVATAYYTKSDREGLKTGSLTGVALAGPALLLASGILGQLPIVRTFDRAVGSTVSLQQYASVIGVDHPVFYGIVVAGYTVLLAAVGGVIQARINRIISNSQN
jgi:hypothetical protein